jgi:type IV secretory pathway protease TraF
VDSIVLTTLPPDAAALAAQRGYLPARVPLLKRVGAVAPQEVCIVWRHRPHRRRAFGRRAAC